MEDLPDLSHLTPEERRHIESVIIRQRQEEEHQNEIMRRKQNEVQILEDTITRARTERLKDAAIDLDATCEICLKTKFADGVGHICNYCNVRCCARCGGKVSLRSNKVIWVCILCRKKQELLSKSGQWIMKSSLIGQDNAMLRRMQEDMQGSIPPGLYVDQSQDKRPKLERAHSAAEKENLPLVQRSGIMLRRQYSHQDKIPGRRLSTSDGGVEMSLSVHSRTLPVPQIPSYHGQPTPRHPAAFPEDDPSLYRGELDGLMRQSSSYQRQQQVYQEQYSDISVTLGHPVIENESGNLRGSMQSGLSILHPHAHFPQQLCPNRAQRSNQQGQRSFSSSEEERSTPEFASDEHDDREHEFYDVRSNKPSVLVTSPGSPDLYAQGRMINRQFRQSATQQTMGGSSIGGRIQVKLSFEAGALQLVMTLVCATGLTPRVNGQPRSSYAKIYLLPDKSEKSKRRTKTLANTNEPRWDQTFIYSGIRWSELRQRSLEITVWDYGRYGANDFLGEVVLRLATSSLNDELEWHYLTAHEENRQACFYQDSTSEEVVTTPGDCHLSPPSTTSRLSDSDTSECDITDCDGSKEHRRTADGASISSIGSSSSHYSSPPPEKELCVDGEHRSRRDISPQGRKRAALMTSREHPASISGYQHYQKDEPHQAGMLGHRSQSAALMDSPSLHYRGRSQSPAGHRSLSPPDHRSIPYSSGYISARFGSRSATATPTGSPKKRQLPQIPSNLHAALKERVAQDLEDRARFIRHRNRPMHTMCRSVVGGWERRYSGLSDSDLPSMGHSHESHTLSHRIHRPRRSCISPEKDVLADLGDSDMESIASVTSSAFSTQSERPRGSRGLIDYAGHSNSYENSDRYFSEDSSKRNGIIKRGQFVRSFSNADASTDEKVDGSLSDTAVGLHVEDNRRLGRKNSPSSKSGNGSTSGGGCSAMQYQPGMGKKSNSTSQLSATECSGIHISSNTIGLDTSSSSGRKRNSTPSSIQRSQEVMPNYHYQTQHLVAPSLGRGNVHASGSGSCASDIAGSLNSISSSEGSSWSPSLRAPGESGQLNEFIEGLGPGQLVGRQVLGAPSLGDIQLSLSNSKGHLEVEVVRARDLQPRPGSKVLPENKMAGAQQHELAEVYPYHLIEFTNIGRRPKIKKIDIVATKWLEYSNIKKNVP